MWKVKFSRRVAKVGAKVKELSKIFAIRVEV
jgi:hypothetical protein